MYTTDTRLGESTPRGLSLILHFTTNIQSRNALNMVQILKELLVVRRGDEVSDDEVELVQLDYAGNEVEIEVKLRVLVPIGF